MSEYAQLGEKKVIVEVDYYDLEKFICKHYNNTDYEFVAAEETSNDMIKSYTVNKKSPHDEYDLKDLEKFKSGAFVHYITRTLLQDLVNNDVIEPAEYHVKVSW